MKKFFQVVMAVKEAATLCYTAAMCIYMFFLLVFKQEGASLSNLFSLLLVSVAAGTAQVALFSNLIIRRLSYGWRLALFVILFGTVLTAVAVAFRWFPVENAGAWVMFGLFFVIIFAAITAGIELYYRLSGKKYDDRLDWYRRNKKNTD